MWYNIVLNSEVRNAAGAVNTPFATYDRVQEMAVDGMHQPEFAFTLTGMPWWQFHIAADVS